MALTIDLTVKEQSYTDRTYKCQIRRLRAL